MGGPHLTDKARAASLVKRRERAAQKAENKQSFDVVIVRSSDPSQYSWQIRRYGAILVKTTDATFVSLSDARVAGEAALRTLVACVVE